MKSMYINSFQIHSNTTNIGYVVNTPVDGLDFPELRQASYNKPGEYGSIVSNVLYGGRRVTLTGTVFGSTAADYEAKRRNLENALGLTRDSNSIVAPLVLKFTTLDDLLLQANCYIKDFKLQISNLTSGKFFIDLYCPDYFLSGQSENQQSVTRSAGGGGIIPIIIPAVLDAQSGGQVVITNNGTVESFPTIYLNAGLTNPTIQNVTNGRYITLALSLTGSDQIIIDMLNKTIIKNGSQSVISNKSSTSQFWWLEKGANTIKFLTESGSDTGNAQIKWRDTYLGV